MTNQLNSDTNILITEIQ